MTDDSELADLDPFDLLDREAARLDAFFGRLPDDDPAWARPSRCAGWSTRDVLAHLASGEPYHHACLDGTVAAFLAGFAERGATDLATANEMAIRERDDRAPGPLLGEWRSANAATRKGFRERADSTVDTSVGDYPCRLQAFHVAGELAVHADDVGVPVVAEEREARTRWRARFSRFALAEAKPHLDIGVDAGRTRVRSDDAEVEVDDDELVEGVAGRLDDSSRLDGPARALLSTMP